MQARATQLQRRPGLPSGFRMPVALNKCREIAPSEAHLPERPSAARLVWRVGAPWPFPPSHGKVIPAECRYQYGGPEYSLVNGPSRATRDRGPASQLWVCPLDTGQINGVLRPPSVTGNRNRTYRATSPCTGAGYRMLAEPQKVSKRIPRTIGTWQKHSAPQKA